MSNPWWRVIYPSALTSDNLPLIKSYWLSGVERARQTASTPPPPHPQWRHGILTSAQMGFPAVYCSALAAHASPYTVSSRHTQRNAHVVLRHTQQSQDKDLLSRPWHSLNRQQKDVANLSRPPFGSPQRAVEAQRSCWGGFKSRLTPPPLSMGTLAIVCTWGWKAVAPSLWGDCGLRRPGDI